MPQTTFRQKLALVIFGLLLSLVAIEFVLRFAGFLYLFSQEQRNRASLKQKGEFRILCFGESTTAEGGQDSYPSQLERILNQRLTPMKISVINKGLPGSTTPLILAQLDYNLRKYDPDMIIAMMGINDTEIALEYKSGFAKIKAYLKNLRLYKLARLLVGEGVSFRSFGNVHLTMGSWYMDQQNYGMAEEMFKKAIQLFPKEDVSYLQLGKCYALQDDYVRAEQMYKKALELGPTNTENYVHLALCYWEMKYFSRAEELLKKAIALAADDGHLYMLAGLGYVCQEKFDLAEEMLKKSIETNPRYFGGYYELGRFYRDRQKYSQAEQVLLQAVALEPTNPSLYIELGWCYGAQEKPKQAEEAFRKAIEVSPNIDSGYGELINYYATIQQHAKIEAVTKDLIKNSRNTSDYSVITRDVYRKLQRILRSRGIILVCVQYPMRNIQPLKNLFDSRQGIIFVDNEGVFRQALENGKYDDFFVDRFGGDFGHCAPKGNRLLANNISEVILKEFFRSP